MFKQCILMSIEINRSLKDNLILNHNSKLNVWHSNLFYYNNLIKEMLQENKNNHLCD